MTLSWLDRPLGSSTAVVPEEITVPEDALKWLQSDVLQSDAKRAVTVHKDNRSLYYSISGRGTSFSARLLFRITETVLS